MPDLSSDEDENLSSEMIKPIDEIQRLHVCQTTYDWIDKASLIFQYEFSKIPLLFDLKGRAAGQYRIRDGQPQIRYNPYIFAKYYEENLKDTVIHEVAHYLTDQLYGGGAFFAGQKRIRPHGQEWKGVMRKLGAKPQTRCNFDISDLPHRSYCYYDYVCDCQTHKLGSRRHKKVLANEARYYCRLCKGSLNPASGQRQSSP
ncbi:MAG: metallopeptidase [Gammaproteobacteria bacterium]|nr:metallopeptidase [Gammaproteobacteria bacterium]